MKVGITVDDNLMKRADEYADANFLTRSGLISMALTQYLNAKDMIAAISRMSYAMEQIAEKGEIDEEAKKELEDFQRLSAMLASSSVNF